MRIATLMILFGFCFSAVLADEMFFPVYTKSQPGLIVEEKYAEAHRADFAKSLDMDVHSIDFWTPSSQDVDQAQQALRKAVDSGQKNPRSIFPKPINGDTSADELQREQVEIESIGTNFDRYVRQYVGVVLEGKRQIFCNFIDPEYSEKTYADISKDYVFFPTGFIRDLHVLQAYYDPETNQCINAGIIGPWTVPPGTFKKIIEPDFVGYIVPKDYAEQSLGFLWGRENVGYWQPTVDDVRMAYAAVHNLIANANDPYDSLFPRVPGGAESVRARLIEDSKRFREVPSILAQWKKYEVQFIGVVVKGKKRILCNFVLCRSDEEDHLHSRYYDPGVPDSGTCSWQIVYDVESKTCSGFGTCGYA